MFVIFFSIDFAIINGKEWGMIVLCCESIKIALKMDSHETDSDLNSRLHAYMDFLCVMWARSNSPKYHFLFLLANRCSHFTSRSYVLVIIQTINESSSVLSCTQTSNYFFPFFWCPPKESCMCQFDCWFNTMNNVCIEAQVKWTVKEMTILAKHCQRREINDGKADGSYG